MGFDPDILKIASLSASGRRGRQFNDFRQSYLRGIIGPDRPDMVILPGDNPDDDILKTLQMEPYREQSRNETVLLYDSTRLKIKSEPTQNFSNNIFDSKKLIHPTVQIHSSAPQSSVVREFTCISWHWELSANGTSQDRYQIGEFIMWLSQFRAWITGKEVLIGGDFNLPMAKITELLNKHNQCVQQGIDSVKPIFRQNGYLDSMTDNITRPERRLRQLKLHRCQQDESQDEPTYFIASKEMQLFETRRVFKESISYRSTSLQVTQRTANPNSYRETTYCPPPTRIREYCPAPSTTQMYIPQRPPKHHGG